MEKIKLLLESHFAHRLNTGSEENIQNSHESMTARSNSLGCGGMMISFRMSNPIALENYIKTHSYFNRLLFYVFEHIFLKHLETYELFKTNLNSHAKKACCTES